MLCVKFDKVRGRYFMKRKLFIVSLMVLGLYALPQKTCGQNVPREYIQADQMFSKGRYTEAIRLYQAALSSPSVALSPGVLHTRIADSYFRMNDYQHALDSYRQAFKYQTPGEQAQTQYWIGFCYLLLGRDAEAVTEFLKIPERYPTSGMLVGTAYYWAGRASERMGRKEEAAEFYRRAGGKGMSSQERFAMKKANEVKKGSAVKGQVSGAGGQGAE
jgi:tetratricopeptide (TPR) repeat protein